MRCNAVIEKLVGESGPTVLAKTKSAILGVEVIQT
jgi:hypothetical protein